METVEVYKILFIIKRERDEMSLKDDWLKFRMKFCPSKVKNEEYCQYLKKGGGGDW